MFSEDVCQPYNSSQKCSVKDIVKAICDFIIQAWKLGLYLACIYILEQVLVL